MGTNNFSRNSTAFVLNGLYKQHFTRRWRFTPESGRAEGPGSNGGGGRKSELKIP